MTGITLTQLIEMLFLPPAGPLILSAIGLIVIKRQSQLGTVLITVSLSVLYLSATPLVSHTLVAGLEPAGPLSDAQLKQNKAKAIVVVAGPDCYYDAPEYNGDTAGPHMLTRLRYAADLYRKTQLPLVVIGGDGLGRGTPAAVYMKEILEKDFRVPVRWSNGRSRHTFDNARYAQQVLSKEGIKTIYLVTHSWHMSRAQEAFQTQGLSVIPAPTSFATENQLGTGIYALIPRSQAMELTNRALHEWVGLLLHPLFS